MVVDEKGVLHATYHAEDSIQSVISMEKPLPSACLQCYSSQTNRFLLAVIGIASFENVSWGIGLLENPDVGKISALYVMSSLINPYVLGGVLIFVGIFSFLGLMNKTGEMPWWEAISLGVQQLILVVVATGVLYAVGSGAYPDGYEKYGHFIWQDQNLRVAVALSHFFVVMYYLEILQEFVLWGGECKKSLLNKFKANAQA